MMETLSLIGQCGSCLNWRSILKEAENEYGLLEHLEGGIFVEWSRANDKDVVQDIKMIS